MQAMSLDQLAAALACPMCRGGTLREDEGGLACERCARRYATEHGVVSFLAHEELTPTNLGEIAGNTFADHYVETMLEKESWSPLLTRQMAWVVEIVDRMLPPGQPDLYALGAGTGFDLRLLLRRRRFARVFASDISPAATAVIPRALADYPGELGLFASEFRRCPVVKRPGAAGLVFQALHHAPDAHAALSTLLDYNFDHLVIVEPLTNAPLKLAARFDLVQRVEYTGTRPDWMHLPRIERIAAERGYRIESRTWWEIPPYFARVDKQPRAARSLFWLFDVASRATNLARFGSMGAIRFTRR
jgi:uncharacterized protein YbaR (Trm112 family)